MHIMEFVILTKTSCRDKPSLLEISVMLTFGGLAITLGKNFRPENVSW